MNNKKTISFADRKRYVEQMCLMYSKLKNTTEYLKPLDIEGKITLKKYDPITLFEKLLKLLTEEESLIIKNDFIERNEKSRWYLDYWCKSSYYKYKHDAVNKFLYLFFS